MNLKKTRSSLNIFMPPWRAVSALVLAALLGFMVPAFAQQGYEPAPVLSASKILPPELLSGANHRVQERVTNDGYLNTYQIDSKFGTFTAVSTAVLRKRIGEINAMVVMEKVQGSKEYVASIKEAGLDAMNSAMSLVTSPVKTLTGAVQGLGAAFSRVGESMTGSKAQPVRGFTYQRRNRLLDYQTAVCLSVRRRRLLGEPKTPGHVE